MQRISIRPYKLTLWKAVSFPGKLQSGFWGALEIGFRSSLQEVPSLTYSEVASSRSIVLIGFMGTGKSLAGKILEQQTGFRRFDTDEIISQKLKMPIEEIFSTHGEERFRELETETLRSLSAEEPAIIVAGGGIVLRAENVDLLRQLGTVVWLDADEATLRTRIHRLDNRPLLRTANPEATLSALLEARQPLYNSAADLRVDTAKKNPKQIAELILKNIRDLPVGE
jgi:shikimate kinase